MNIQHYSQDLTTSANYYLFSNLKKFLVDKSFTLNYKDIAVASALDGYFADIPESHCNYIWY